MVNVGATNLCYPSLPNCVYFLHDAWRFSYDNVELHSVRKHMVEVTFGQ